MDSSSSHATKKISLITSNCDGKRGFVKTHARWITSSSYNHVSTHYKSFQRWFQPISRL